MEFLYLGVSDHNFSGVVEACMGCEAGVMKA